MSDWSDVEGDLRDYLRADATVTSVFANRGFFGLPVRVAFPAFVIRRVAGGQDPGEAPIDRPLLQIDVWGKKGDKHGAFVGARAIRDALTALRRTTQGGSLLFGAQVIGVVFSPDPETDQPRYSLTVDLTARAVPA